MKKPFAITLDVGTSLENRTGSWRTLRPTYVHKLPPCNHQCPCRRRHSGLACSTPKAATMKKPVRSFNQAQSAYPPAWDAFAIAPCEGARNRGKLDAYPSASTPSNASSGTTPLENGYKFVRGPNRRQASKS